MPAARHGRTGTMLVLAATVGFGLNPTIARVAFDAGASADVAVLARYLAPAVLLAPALFWWRPPSARLALIAVGAGLAAGSGTVAYYRALVELPAPAVLAVYYTYPLFVLVLGRALFGVRPGAAAMAAAAAVVAGAGLAIGPAGVAASGWGTLLLAVAAPATWALLLLTISLVIHTIPTAPQVSLVGVGAAAAVVPFLLVSPGPQDGSGPLTALSASAVAWLLCLGVAGVALPALLLTAGARLSGPTVTALVGSFELVVALVSGYLVFGDRIGPWQVLGALLIVTGVAVAAVRAPTRQQAGVPRTPAPG